MKRKKLVRMISLLMALMMICGMLPMSASASETDMGRWHVSDTVLVGEDNIPQSNMTFHVQYVVRGKYTYSGEDLLVGTEENISGQVSGYGGSVPAGCEYDDASPRKAWNRERNTLILYCKPLKCEVELRYSVIAEKDGQLTSMTFQTLQNRESGLEQGDRLNVQDFLKDLPGAQQDHIILKTYQGKDLNQIEPVTIPSSYLELSGTVASASGKKYELSYYGYTAGGEAGNNLNSISREKTISWSYGASNRIVLYFLLGEADASSSAYHTITW